MIMKDIYTRRELASELGVGLPMIDKWLKNDQIKILHRGSAKNSKILIDGNSVGKFLKARVASQIKTS